MKVLITGASGYVGQHACHALNDAGMEVWGLDTEDGPSSLDGICKKWFSRDFQTLLKVDEALRDTDAIVHLAAVTSVGEAEENPWLYYRQNSAYTKKLIDSWRASNPSERPFVFASSAAVYGVSDSTVRRPKIAETDACRPTNAYGKSKLHVEHVLDDYGRAYGLPWAALRFFNVAGAWPERGLGEQHEPETHLIPRLIRATSTGESFTVFGRQWPTLDGTCERDYVHVRDVADAIVASVKALTVGSTVGEVNVGSGVGTSVMAALRAVEGKTGRTIHVQHEPWRRGDVARLIADIGKARQVLEGWCPHRSTIGRIVEDAAEFQTTLMP